MTKSSVTNVKLKTLLVTGIMQKRTVDYRHVMMMLMTMNAYNILDTRWSKVYSSMSLLTPIVSPLVENLKEHCESSVKLGTTVPVQSWSCDSLLVRHQRQPLGWLDMYIVYLYVRLNNHRADYTCMLCICLIELDLTLAWTVLAA